MTTAIPARIAEARAVGATAIPVMIDELDQIRADERARLILRLKGMAIRLALSGRPGAADVAHEIARELERERA